MPAKANRILINTAALASLYGVTPMAIYLWRKRGCPFVKLKSPGMKLPPVRFDLKRVAAWIEKNAGRKPDARKMKHYMGNGN